MNKRRYVKKQSTVVRAIRLSEVLNRRIHDLAAKNLVSYNAWVVVALQQKAFKHSEQRMYLISELKPIENDSSASGKE